MRRLLTGAIAVALWCNCIPPGLSQQSRNTAEQLCEAAIVNAEQLLIGDRAMWLSDFRVSEVGYDNYPHDRSVAFRFSFSGDGSEDVIESPRLLSSIAGGIMNACNGVGLIDFHLAETDYIRTFGWIGNTAREFECVDPGQDFYQWGYSPCP